MPATPRDIVMAAYQYLSDVTPSTQKIADVRIEELEPDASKAYWTVVLSYDAVGDFPFDKQREYKEFKIDTTTEVVKVDSMKIRKV